MAHPSASSTHGNLARLVLASLAIALGSGALAVWLGFDVRPEPAFAHVRATAPTGAAAPPTSSDRWPDGTVTYFNASPEHDWAVQQAVSAWNASGAHVRFVATTADAGQLVIRSDARERCGEGRATIGYTPAAVMFVFRQGTGEACSRFAAARVLAHELGHVLGLSHDDAGCAVMNSSGDHRGSRLCPASERWEWRCRLVERSDAVAVATLYGGTPARASRRAACPLYQPLQPAPARIRIVRERSTSRRIAISFVRPADAATPRFLGRGEPSFAYTYRRGACAAKPPSARYRWTVAPGRVQMLFERPLRSGVHCFRIWAADGRLSRTAATLQLHVKQ